jgi:hypothetical protein
LAVRDALIAFMAATAQARADAALMVPDSVRDAPAPQ